MQGWKALIRGHSHWLLLLATGMLIPIITNLASSWLEMTVGRTPNRLLQLLAIGAAAAVALWVLGMALHEKPEPLVLVPSDARPPQMPGLIVLVGRGRPGEKTEMEHQAAVQAIRYHLGAGGDGPLKACWLVASAGEKGSVGLAGEIGKLCETPGCKMVIREVGNPFSVQDTYDVVQRIYAEEIDSDEFRELGLGPAQVICDFTSGTAPMTAGMVLACGRNRPMQYTTGRRAKAGEPEIASVPLLVEFRPARQARRK
jgi:hypothetical protein